MGQISPSVQGPCLNLPGPCHWPLGPHDLGLAQGTVPSAAATAELGKGLHAHLASRWVRNLSDFVQGQLSLGPGDCPLACPTGGPALHWAPEGSFSHQDFVNPKPRKKSVNRASHDHSVIPAGTPPPFSCPRRGVLHKPAQESLLGAEGSSRDMGPRGQELRDRSNSMAFLADLLHPSRKWP